MAEFSSLVITEKGQALITKMMISGGDGLGFTKIATSSTAYPASSLATLTSLSGIKQIAGISNIEKVSNTQVKLDAAVENSQLTEGYTINTIGLYATDPDDGEILYAVCRALVAGYIPAYNGLSVSGATFELVVGVGAAENVELEVDPAVVATIGDIQDLQKQISDLQAFVGYTDDDIYGVEVDFKNKKFTRLAGAVNKTPGAMFDNIQAFGRRRCNLADDGTVNAYHGELGYAEDGSNGQVMVEQPKFYYRVVPLELEKIIDGKGFHMRKARYYVSDTKKDGFKLHPAFIHNGKEKNFIYLSAYDGSVFDVSAGQYILNDAQTTDFTAGSGDKMVSILGAKPASGLTQELTRSGSRNIAQNRGTGWFQSYAATVAASQLLFLIEYASFNTQTAIGRGNVDKTDDGSTSMTEITGATTNLGNKSGSVVNGNGINIVSYRGEENFWGNIWKWVDGLNIEAKGLHNLYVADHGFTDNIGTSPYKDAGITLAKVDGYISAFAYNEEFDWLFFASETVGDSSLPVGDYFYQNNTYDGWFTAVLGGHWVNGSVAGGFYWYVLDSSGGRSRGRGGRLVYVPNVA